MATKIQKQLELEQSAGATVEQAYEFGKRTRLPYERMWYTMHAAIRSNQYLVWSDGEERLVAPIKVPNRIRLTINRMQSLWKARLSKFVKNRPIAIVVPSTLDVQDKLDARLTTKAIEYQWRMGHLEKLYAQTAAMAGIYGRAYWFYHWNPDKLARVKVKVGDEEFVDVAPVGDIEVELVSPFQVFVGDPSISELALQPWILRVRNVGMDAVRRRWPHAKDIASESTALNEALNYQYRIGALNPTTAGASVTESGQEAVGNDSAILYEYYEHPSPTYPKGRYIARVKGMTLEVTESLPFGFSDLYNPYPATDFPDQVFPGQFYIPAVLETVLPLQREYNLFRSKIAEQVRLQAHPKIMVATQHRLAPNVWTPDAGEIVEYVGVPGLDKPFIVPPPQISADVWHGVELMQKEMSDVTNIHPESMGQIAGSTSGFQTNLAQEASDAVHAPDIRQHELAVEEVGLKLRRLMKRGYSLERMMSIAGHQMQPEVFQFSTENIDDQAEIRVETGSALPTLKAAKIQMISELWKAGLLGSPQNPEDVRQVRILLEMGTIEEQFDYDRQDEEAARLENAAFERGKETHKPEFFENHAIHYRQHTTALKAPSSQGWPQDRRIALIRHTIEHAKYLNPQTALAIANEYGLTDLVGELTSAITTSPAPMAGGPAPEGAPQAAGSPSDVPPPSPAGMS